MAEVQTAPPLAKYLASTEKKVRDKSVKQLTAFLSNTDNVLPKKDMDKLWKGIFYCFWMSDKPLVQQALATELAEIILAITSPASSLAFLRGFWEATVREWTGIDRLRIDKYYMLVRRFVSASFRLLICEKWEESLCEEYNSILTQRGGPLCTNDQRVPAGLIFHLSDIYIEELDKALGSTDSPQPAPLLTILSPFISLAAQASTSVAYKRIQSALFEPILESLSVPAEEEAEDSEEPKTKRRRTEDEAMFPHLRANVCIERHQRTDALSIKKKLLRTIFDVASQPETRDANRRKMYALWKEGSDDVEDDE